MNKLDSQRPIIEEDWMPNKDEWCWFYNPGDRYYQLHQFRKMVNNEFTTQTAIGSSFVCCEKFIGTLPTNLK